MKAILALTLALATAFSVNLQAAAPPKKPAAKKPDKPEKVDPVAFLKRFDADGDSKLDKAELSTGLKSLKHNSVTTKNDSWKRFDADGDGKINLAELKKLLDENSK